jgi:probable HAF family extracellular repeat protein
MTWFCRLALVLAAIPCTALAATAYVAVPIGNLGGASTYGTAINASGQVAGWGDTDTAGAIHRHAFVFSSGVLTNLGTLPGGTQSFAYAINDAGVVVGASNAGGVPQLHATLFSDGGVNDLASRVGGTISNAYGINLRGDFAGASNRTGISHGYFAGAGSSAAIDLGTFGGILSQAYGVNGAGNVTGYAHVPSGDAHAFRYDGAMTDLGTLGGKVSIGNAINVADHVVGQASLPGDTAVHAFVHDGHTMIDVGTLGGNTSEAHAINAGDTVVGEALDGQGVLRAFVSYQGAPIDLNGVTSGLNGAVLSTATAINDAGQIVAMSCTAPLVCQQAFRLDPTGAAKVAAIEYHHAAFDHYFMTAIPDEIAKLDAGIFAGWTRTGASFNVYVGDQVGTSPVCRFFSTAFDPKSSHFYTPFQGECVLLQRGATWQFEARVFNIAVPDIAGNCPAGTQLVYRLYNQGMGAAPNHRYTTSPATRATMIAQGWIPEGLGPDAVEMCSPV